MVESEESRTQHAVFENKICYKVLNPEVSLQITFVYSNLYVYLKTLQGIDRNIPPAWGYIPRHSDRAWPRTGPPGSGRRYLKSWSAESRLPTGLLFSFRSEMYI